MERTHRWAKQCFESHRASPAAAGQALFGIVQGGTFERMREESALAISSVPFHGYAVGGLAVGESKAQMYDFTELVTGRLPPDKPRYLMGVGSPEDLVEGVARGIDMFDCALPTRVARNGSLFTPAGRIGITKRRYAEQQSPVDESCDCYACANYSAAYLRRLIPGEGTSGVALGLNTQSALRVAVDGTNQTGGAGRPVRRLSPGIPGPVPPHQRGSPPRAENAVAQGEGGLGGPVFADQSRSPWVVGLSFRRPLLAQC